MCPIDSGTCLNVYQLKILTLTNMILDSFPPLTTIAAIWLDPMLIMFAPIRKPSSILMPKT
jgi:hypothetical protein